MRHAAFLLPVLRLDGIHLRDELSQWAVLAAPVFKHVHALVLQDRAGQLYGEMQLCQQSLAVKLTTGPSDILSEGQNSCAWCLGCSFLVFGD